jgi:hypothetical protein
MQAATRFLVFHPTHPSELASALAGLEALANEPPSGVHGSTSPACTARAASTRACAVARSGAEEITTSCPQASSSKSDESCTCTLGTFARAISSRRASASERCLGSKAPKTAHHREGRTTEATRGGSSFEASMVSGAGARVAELGAAAALGAAEADALEVGAAPVGARWQAMTPHKRRAVLLGGQSMEIYECVFRMSRGYHTSDAPSDATLRHDSTSGRLLQLAVRDRV